MIDLYQRSIDVILEGQSESGAYIACPTMADYAYCWFRDGSYTAYAMDLAGHHESAHRFYDWCAVQINARQSTIERALAKAGEGKPLTETDCLHTRYTLSGEEGTDAWPNFQLDGFGTYLWGLCEHLRMTDTPLSDAWRKAADGTARYLAGLWQLPNHDLWEEFPDQVHVYTLAAIYGGLATYAAFTDQPRFAETAHEIKSFVHENGIADGHFVKFLGSTTVDASLLGIALPYGAASLGAPLFLATVQRIEGDLQKQISGVRRYATDVYYGGGEWILLTAWLGWVYAQQGQIAKAEAVYRWIEAQATANGDLPEQVPVNMNAPEWLQQWIDIRGPIATPLLWSHAMFIILHLALKGAASSAQG